MGGFAELVTAGILESHIVFVLGDAEAKVEPQLVVRVLLGPVPREHLNDFELVR